MSFLYVIMKAMKKIVPLLAVFLIFISCTSSPSQPAADYDSSVKAKTVTRFDDWKYKGFGMELPEWVEPAIDGKYDKVAKHFGCQAENIQIFTASGINLDQSENKLKNQINQNNSENGPLTLIDGFWVRNNLENEKSEEPYITVLIYAK